MGLRLAYAPEAVVYNCTPLNIADFVSQRRRIWAGHLQMKKEFGYSVSTLSSRRVLRSLVATMDRKAKPTAWTFGAAVLELYARLLGMLDLMIWRRDHTVWEVVESTKLMQHDIL